MVEFDSLAIKNTKKSIKRMKIQHKLIFTALTLMLLFSCRNDEFIVEKGVFTLMFGAHLSGVIVDRDNQPISNAVVTISSGMALTDENGVFSFRDIELSYDGSLVKVEKSGYFDGFFFAYGEAEEQNYMEGILIERGAQQFQSSVGATITINGGANIIFDPNSIVTGGGQSYEGVVNISAHWYNPASDETAFSMPGDLRGIDQNADPVQLVTYGMMAVELRSPSGVELQLAPESTATLKFPISEDTDISQNDVIPMWYLDEESGIWIEEGSSKMEGDFLVGEVSHFSFWNCDIPYPLINISGSLVAEDGTPLPFQRVLIKDNNNNISRSGSTNAAGVFSGKVPADVELSVFHFVCGEAVFLAELDVLTEDINLGPITAETVNSTTISAILEDCAMQPITNGYVKIITPTTTKIVITDHDGHLEYPYFHCGETDVTMVAYDFASPLNSEALDIETSNTIQDLGTVYLCDTIPGEYIRYLINGESHVRPLDQIEAYVADDRILYIYAYDEYDPIAIGPSSLLFKYDIMDGVAQYYARGYNAIGEYFIKSGDDLEVEVSDIGDVGSFVTLTFDNGEFEGELKVYIDEYIESGLISGKVWLDENENGIQDSNEQGLAGRRISMLYLPVPNFLNAAGYSLYPQPINQANFVYSDNDGNFEFNGVFVQKISRLTFNAEGGDGVTIHNAGNDNIDSDFYDRFNALDQYDTDDFILEPGEEKVNFGLGIKQ